MTKTELTRPIYDEACRLWAVPPTDEQYAADGWDDLFAQFARPTELGLQALEALYVAGFPRMPNAWIAHRAAVLYTIAQAFVVDDLGEVFGLLAQMARRDTEALQAP